MKQFLLLVLFCLPFAGAMAQNPKPPALCKPCLFYAGDLEDGDPNSDGFPNEGTVPDPGTQTFGEIMVPKGRSILVEGILFQTLFQFTNKLDPNVVTWQIRTDDIYENGGTLVASGSGTVFMQPTGRQLDGAVEYTLAVKVTPPVQLSGGSRHAMGYWFNLLPLCTNNQDPSCSTGIYYVSNTALETNAYHGSAQVPGGTVINSPLRGYQWDNLCELGITGCARISFGLMGKVVQ